MSALGLFNFVVLQWFGVRLARVYRTEQYDVQPHHVSLNSDGSLSLGMSVSLREVPVGWTLLRWVWPLTGWLFWPLRQWSDFRWIARRR